MSITNYPDADFTPNIPNSIANTGKQSYNPTGSFRFWAQKVLPTVYDDSLSYYEILTKVVNYLNAVIQNVDSLNESVDNTNSAFDDLQAYVNTSKNTLIMAYSKLQDYVNTYFDSLDVQEEINAKLDDMASDGSLSEVVSPFIPSLVSDWLSDNITPTSPAIDASLSISGAGADAKVTGEFVRANSAELTDIRVGADGTVYENAGDAVRGQVNGLNGRLGGVENALTLDGSTPQYNIEWIENSYVETDGRIVPYKGWHRSDYMPLNGAEKLVFDPTTIPSGSNNFNGYFTEDKTWIDYFGIKQGSNETVPPANAFYFMVSCESNVNFGITAVIPSKLFDAKEYNTRLENANALIANNSNRIANNSNRIDAVAHSISLVESNIKPNVPDAYIYRGEIPQYYFAPTEQEPLTFDDNEYLSSKAESIPKGKHIVFITDLHAQGNANTKNSIKLYQYLRGFRGIAKVVNGGDNFDKYTSKYIAAYNSRLIMNSLISSAGADMLEVLGNHDLNTANITEAQKTDYTIPYEVAYDIYMKHLEDVVNFCNRDVAIDAMSITTEQKTELKYWLKMNYYVDDASTKIRYIVINTGNGQYGNGVVYDVFRTYGIAECIAIFDWLHDVLETTPANYDIVLAGHVLVNGNGEVTSSTAQWLFQILQARKNNAKITLSVQTSTDWKGLWDSSSMAEMDFTESPVIRHIIVLNGHWHVDFASTYLDIPIITTQCDAFARTGTGSSPMTSGTITEQCFDVVTITDNKLYLTRIGAGTDRVINLS